MKRTYLTIVSCLLCHTLLSQQGVTISWGLHIAPIKFHKAIFEPKTLFLPDFGTIAINNSSATMYRSDISIYRSRIHRKKYFEYGLGLRSQEYSVNDDAIAARILSQQSLIVSNYTLTPHVAIGYFIWNRSALQIMLRTGVAYDLLHFKTDYNYFNALLKLNFRDETIIDLLGEPVVVNLNDQYSFPKVTLSTGIEFRLYRFGLGILYEFQDKHLSFFNNKKKPYFLNTLNQIKLQITVLLKNKYVVK